LPAVAHIEFARAATNDLDIINLFGGYAIELTALFVGLTCEAFAIDQNLTRFSEPAIVVVKARDLIAFQGKAYAGNSAEHIVN